MVRNKLTDLTNTLFAQLETLDDRDLTADELKVELQRSKQMVAISGQILQAGQLALDVANEMNQKFGLSLTEKQIKSYRRNNNLHSGLTGRFEKGQTPHNKGKKYPNMPKNSGQFKKGNRPPNYVPVGTINYTTDGYPKEKIGEPNRWVLKHRKVWEDHHGPIPKGYSVCFLDRNKTNYDISNLILLSNEELARMNQNNYFSSDPELTRLGAGITKLSRKIKQQE